MEQKSKRERKTRVIRKLSTMDRRVFYSENNSAVGWRWMQAYIPPEGLVDGKA